MESFKCWLRQAVSLDHTHIQNSVFPSKGFIVYILTSISLSHLFSFSSSQIATHSAVTIYGSTILQALSISSLPPFSPLSLPLEHHISLWSTVLLHRSLSPSLSLSPQSIPLSSSVSPSISSFAVIASLILSLSLSLWSALRGLFIQQQPTQSRAEQNRAVKAVWLAKMGITSQPQQNSSLSFASYILAPLCFCHLISTQVCCLCFLVRLLVH